MERKAVSRIIPILLLIIMLTLRFYIQQAEVKGIYNVTGYAHPVLRETPSENSQRTKFITVAISAHSEVQVGVKPGDWIEFNYTVIGAPSETTLPTWIKVEFLNVKRTNVTVQVTMHMSNGTEQSETKTVDVVAGGGTIGAFSGFIIPANSTTGDSIYISGYGNITIAGETDRTYAGASRIVIYATFSHARARYYWDKQTGVMTEASVSSGGITATAKVTQTSLWGVAPFWTQWWFWAITVAGIAVLIGAVYLKKKKLPTAFLLPQELPIQPG